MAYNDRVQYDIKGISHNQLAQVGRTEFTPGKATSLPGDMNWPKENLIPVGTPVFNESVSGPLDETRVRVIKLGRNSVSDQTLVSVPADPLNTTQVNDGRKERTAGYDWAQEA